MKQKGMAKDSRVKQILKGIFTKKFIAEGSIGGLVLGIILFALFNWVSIQNVLAIWGLPLSDMKVTIHNFDTNQYPNVTSSFEVHIRNKYIKEIAADMVILVNKTEYNNVKCNSTRGKNTYSECKDFGEPFLERDSLVIYTFDFIPPESIGEEEICVKLTNVEHKKDNANDCFIFYVREKI